MNKIKSQRGKLLEGKTSFFAKQKRGIVSQRETNDVSPLSTMTEDKNFWELIDYPVTTEKAVRIIEDENKLTFQLKRLETRKQEIKKSFEEEFKAKVEKVNTLIDRKGKKRVVIKLKKEFSAGDIGVKLGII